MAHPLARTENQPCSGVCLSINLNFILIDLEINESNHNLKIILIVKDY